MAKDIKIDSLTQRLSEAEAKIIAHGITLNAQISGLNDQRSADAILIDDLKAQIALLTEQRTADAILINDLKAQIDVLTDRAVGSIDGLVALDWTI